MRIACVDKTASDRVILERFLDESFRECRKSVGHLLVARLIPTSKEELLINSLPDIVVIGSSFSIDESLLLAREIKSFSNETPVFIFLRPEDYTVLNLKRFSGYVSEVFSITDLPSRFVYRLTTSSSKQLEKKGYLLTFQGVKGGVGVTSVVAGTAHAFQDIGKSVVIVDMSRRGDLCQFCLSDRWQSSNFSQLIIDSQLPDAEHLFKIVIELPNGIHVLPPPAGADELREQWLRDPSRLEVGLSFIELLLEKYDVVLVDMAHAEGILPFAIECRADSRIFISANEPGSVHMLTTKIADFSIPVDGVTKFLINQTSEKGLTHDDILDFIAWSKGFTEEMLYPQMIPFENKAAFWMGTGNTIFTEGTSKIQKVLIDFASESIGLSAKDNDKKRRLPFQNLIRSLSQSKAKRFIPFNEREKLPYFPQDKEIRVKTSDIEIGNSLNKTQLSKSNLEVFEVGQDTINSLNNEQSLEKFVYEPPKIRANE